MQNVPNKIIVHHSADSSKDDQLKRIDAWHMQRQFPYSSLGYFVGYHYLVQRTGNIVKTREDWEEGAHCKGMNFRSIGVCLEGNFNLEYPNEKQEESLGWLLKELCERYKLISLDIEPHRKFSDTDCYGRLLSDKWAANCYLMYQTSFIRKMLELILIKLRALITK